MQVIKRFFRNGRITSTKFPRISATAPSVGRIVRTTNVFQFSGSPILRINPIQLRILTRTLMTNSFLPPRGSGSVILRVLGTTMTAIIGYLYYQFNKASSWLYDQTEFLREWGMDSMISVVGIINSFNDLIGGVAGDGQEGSWNPLSWKPKPKPGPTSSEDFSKDKTSFSSGDEQPKDPASQEYVDQKASDHFHLFIKKMIEIRNILKFAEMESSIHLPSIVVIGSQSSGKSSVLESIVGHSFLPKGNNMVTRRPLELTLVNSPTAPRDYAIFTQMETGPVYDFVQVQKTLTELNLAVPENQWISTKPIELTICSRNVPDLSLVDLPGYIQINNKNQPPILKEKIAKLCEKYIMEDNIILAVCPADVDFANAEALKVSRAVDPHGDRTIGVITKLDLVNPEYSKSLINNEDYPLRLGYIGVVCKPPEVATQPRALSLITSGSRVASGLTASIYEDAYFKENKGVFEEMKGKVGIGNLRHKLTSALEASMGASLANVLENVQEELSELKYLLKVEYSDRTISPEGYLSYLTSTLKQGLDIVAVNYSRARVRDCLRKVLQARLLAVCEATLWNAPMPGKDPDAQVGRAVAMLTRSGVGRITANALLESTIEDVRQVIKDGPLNYHPSAKEKLLRQVEVMMRSSCQNAIEQVENAIKPFKHNIEYTDEEWKESRRRVLNLLRDSSAEAEEELALLQKEVGPRRLRKVVQHLSKPEVPSAASSLDPTSIVEGSLINPTIIARAKEAVVLSRRIKAIKCRITYLEEAGCSQPEITPSSSSWSSWIQGSIGGDKDKPSKESIVMEDGRTLHVWNPCQTKCPEVYLYLVMGKLLQTASLYVHHELVHEFLNPFPGELASSLQPTSASSPLTIDKREIMQFINENPAVSRHLQLQDRSRTLENVRERLVYLQQLRSASVVEPEETDPKA